MALKTNTEIPSNFKREHIVFYYKCEKHSIEKCCIHTLSIQIHLNLVENVRHILATAIEGSWSPQQVVLCTEEQLQETSSLTNFKEFVAEEDKVWSLWADVVFVNCYSYTILYLEVGSSAGRY